MLVRAFNPIDVNGLAGGIREGAAAATRARSSQQK
jgi:hypothetical protein